jgi:hypothetical protein
MKIRLLPTVALALVLSGPPMISACSSHSKTTTTTSQATAAQADPDATPPTTTTTTTTTRDDEPDSVLGATFHAIGTIVLFPFRLVGDAISLIV